MVATRTKPDAQPQQFTELQHGTVTLRALPLWPGYWAGNDGNVYSVRDGQVRQLRPIQNKKLRYPTVTLYHPARRYARRRGNGKVHWCKKPCPQYIHKLISSVWLPPRPSKKHTVDHRDENPRNNKPDNLRWLTFRENWDAYQANHPDLPRHSHPGEQNPTAKLTDKDVYRILALRGMLPATMVGPVFGVCPTQVGKIWRGLAWRHLKGVVGQN